MAGKKPADPLKAKEAKQKKIAIGGAVILLILLAIQGPKVLKKMHGSGALPPVAATTTPAPGTPAPAGSPSPAPGTPTTPSTGTGSLLSENEPTAAIGQLSSFGRFASKDPFASQVPTTSGKSGTKKPASPNSPSPPEPPAPPSPPTSTGPSAPLTSAVISVNGVKEQVQVGANFPASQPFFHLVSISAHSARISIAGGSLANGSATVTLTENKTLTLMNTNDGTRYKIVLLPQGTSLTSTSTGTTGTGTTPAVPPATTTGTTSTGTTTTKP